ncbi:MAG: hypothetical protein ACI4PR_04410 [Acutalibacteraceae bacterium]
MNLDKEIGIEKILRDELIDNYIFRYELFECLKKSKCLNWGIINEKIKKSNLEELKKGVGILEAEYATSIGNITIYTDIEKGDVIVLKSDKIKDRSSEDTDKRQMQDTL